MWQDTKTGESNERVAPSPYCAMAGATSPADASSTVARAIRHLRMEPTTLQGAVVWLRSPAERGYHRLCGPPGLGRRARDQRLSATPTRCTSVNGSACTATDR